MKSRESQTGEEPAATPAAATPAPAATPGQAATPAPEAAGSSAVKSDKAKGGTERSGAQRHADHVIEKIKADLEKRRAVIVLVWSSRGEEDKIVHRRLTKEINRRGGRVRVYLVPVKEVGRYDGLLGGLSLAQTPSTVVIAPDATAKVLGGLVSTARIDRLTSAATLTKPEKNAKP